MLNEAEKGKLKKFLKKHKKKLIAGAALLGTAGAVAGGAIVHNNRKNYGYGKKYLQDKDILGEPLTDDEVNKLNKKTVRKIGKSLNKFKKAEDYANKVDENIADEMNNKIDGMNWHKHPKKHNI